ncbi:Inner centromere protein, ARK-binding domain protein [Rhodotorula toruloides]|nr:Inner centromere protein, ARK-binding domain protein [Rhodotorula toruloides]
MLRTHVKAEDIDPTLPTPSPSPPRFSRRLPTCRDPAELKEQHVAKARAAAERVRLEHLAQALQSSGTGVKAEEGDVGEQSGMQRYSYMVEQEEDGRKVSKRVTVIVPAATPPPAFTLDKVTSGLAFLPPPASYPSPFPRAPPARCIPLPSLHRLSLAPPQPPVPLFHSHVHPTTAMLSSLASLAHDSLQAQIDDYADAHRWMDSFFEKLAPKGQQKAGGSRLAMSELMKTPGRKRVATASSAHRTLPSSKKDPVATLLFPAPASPKRSPATGKENSPAASSGQSSSRRMLSPLGQVPSLNKAKAVSPLRAPSPRTFGANNQSARNSPAPVESTSAADVKALDFAPPLELDEPEPFELPAHELSNVMEEDEEEDEDEEEEARQVSNVLTKKEEAVLPAAAKLDEEEKANLSIIGEEEEDEDTSTGSVVTAPSTQPPSLVGAPSIISETQFSQPHAASPKPAEPARALSPQSRSVSGASSIAPEADTEEMSVPLNDAPSTLRSEALASSLSSSTLRTPGGSSTSRFTLGTYSAAKLGSIGLGSSPPPTAPATVGPAIASSRISTGGAAPRQLNFVGLPKKSLGHGLGLGRNWLASGSDSQGSTASQTSSAPSVPAEQAQSGSSTATGATKRKSLEAADVANKAPKLSQVPAGDIEQDEARKRREALANRIQSMQARQSNLGGRTSNVAGPFGGVSNLFGSTKPISTTTPLFHSTSTAPVAKPLLANAPILPSSSSVNIAAELNGPAARRPSVMERVKSFESNTTGTEHVHPPSPSKIPAAFNSTAHHSPRPNSPPPTFSSGRFASPPASPRPASRAAPSGLPVATFGSPRSAQLMPPAAHAASPRLGGITRSPSSFVSASISSILSPPRQAVKVPVVEPKSPARSPVRVANTPPTAVVRSTTPVASPPGMGLADMLKKAEDARSLEMDDELEDEEEEEEDDRPAIRAINASTPASAVVEVQAKAKAKAAAEERQQREAEAKRAAEQAARDLEEQEAQCEREELLKKRLPSLPEPKQQEDDEDDSGSEDGEGRNTAVLTKAVREDLTSKASPSRVVMPGGFGNGSSSHEHCSSAEASDAEDDEAVDDEEDRTTMSMMSSVTASSTLNFSQNHHPFKPVTAHKVPQASRPASKASIASTASTSTTFGLNRSTSAAPASAIKKVKPDVKAVQRTTAAAKKEKEERDRKAAAASDKRSMLQKKQEEERKVKAEGLEKKRKEREEQASKAKASSIRGVKPKAGDDEPSKKRKIEPEAKSRLDPKKATQPGRAITPSASSQQLSSSTRTGAMGPPTAALNKSAGLSSMLNKSNGPSAALNKSAGASAMIGHSFMSNKINLPGSASSSSAARPANPTKPFGSSAQNGARSQQPTPQAKPEPEPFIELPDVDSEYSDSEDEDAQEAKKAAMPRWAQSPNLARALELQQTINPDEIFGPIPKLSIRDMFRNAESAARLRVRTSSAQWEGTDALTQADIERYQRAMGFARTETRPPPPQ